MKTMEKLEKQIIDHAKKAYPNECCGLIAEGNYYPCENIADNPTDTFIMAKKDWRPAEVVVHSHTNGIRYLSGADRAAQHKSGLDWWLAVRTDSPTDTDEWEIIKYPYTPLLKGREFDYGKYDCVSLMVDVFGLCGITFTPFERHEDIIKNDIVGGALARGFYEVDFKDIQVGDVIMTSVRGVANHASFYLGNEQVLHHPLGGLSRVEAMDGVWHKCIHCVLRHKDWQPKMIQAILNDIEVEQWQQ